MKLMNKQVSGGNIYLKYGKFEQVLALEMIEC